MQELILAALDRIEGKVDDVSRSQATLTERVGNLKDGFEKHVEADAATNKEHAARISRLEHFKTSLKTRIAAWAAGIAVVISIAAALAKDAIAGVFKAG